MTITKPIYYHESGMGEKDYAILEFDPKNKQYTIRRGYSLRKAGIFDFHSEEECYDMADFLGEFPEYKTAVYRLKHQMQTEV